MRDQAIRRHGIETVAALIESGNDVSTAVFGELGYNADVPANYYRKLSRPEAWAPARFPPCDRFLMLLYSRGTHGYSGGST